MRHESVRTEYQEPTSLAEAQDKQRELVEEIATIAAQLTDPDRRKACEYCKHARNPECRNCAGFGSVRYSTDDYAFWRRGAMTAMKAKETTLRRIGQWVDAHKVAEQRSTPSAPAVNDTDASRLVGAAYLLLKNLVDDDVDFEPAELAIINSLKKYLEAQCPPNNRFPARSASVRPNGRSDSTPTAQPRTATGTPKS